MLRTKLSNLAVATSLALAGLTSVSAAALSDSLMPLGGEKAANAEGTIPAWDGSPVPSASQMVGDIPLSVYGEEKPLFTINSQNYKEYADNLTPGAVALLNKYPESFRMDVYPGHRTARAPQIVYERTISNAEGCKLSDTQMAIENCYGGIPFPAPKTGLEVVWNYLLKVQPESTEFGFKNLVVTSDGTRSLATQNINSHQFPYYYKDSDYQNWISDQKGLYFIQRFDTKAPAFKVGESLVVHDGIDKQSARKAWQYLVGQRRVRRAPTIGYDTPDFVASGANYFDEVEGFFGAPDRFDWKIVGKKEIIVPYNNNKLVTASVEDAYNGHHFNPDLLRWELHRVWELEATVADGKRHAVPKRSLFVDEDSWLVLLVDGYDADGNLWRTSIVPPFFVPKVPALQVKPAMVFNLEANTSSLTQSLNGEEFFIVERKEDEFFTGEAVAADSLR